MKKQYNITVNEEQLRVILSSLEVLSRLYSGQWDMVFDLAFRYNKKYKDIYKKMDKQMTLQDVEKLHGWDIRPNHKGIFYQLIDFLKYYLLGLVSNEGLGVGSKEACEDMTTAYDMIQVFRRNCDDSREPTQFDKKNKLAEIEETK